MTTTRPTSPSAGVGGVAPADGDEAPIRLGVSAAFVGVAGIVTAAIGEVTAGGRM